MQQVIEDAILERVARYGHMPGHAPVRRAAREVLEEVLREARGHTPQPRIVVVLREEGGAVTIRARVQPMLKRVSGPPGKVVPIRACWCARLPCPCVCHQTQGNAASTPHSPVTKAQMAREVKAHLAGIRGKSATKVIVDDPVVRLAAYLEKDE